MLAGMFLFLASSAMFTWFLLAFFFIMMIYCVEYSSGVGATFLVLAAALIAYFVYGFSTIGYVIEHPLYSLGFVGAYFGLGVLWAGFKWMFFCNAAARAYAEIPVKSRASTFNFRGRYQSVPVQASENKATVLLWMSYWPFSFIWTMIDDPVKRIFAWIYHQIAGGLQKYSNRAFADLYKGEK